MKRCFSALAIAFVILLCNRPPSVTAEPRDARGVDIEEFCDFRPGVPISDKCYGFIEGVVGMLDNETMEAYSTTTPTGMRACIPHNLSVEQVFEAIRPLLARPLAFVCAGKCNSASYLTDALISVYPCK
jgi:hypothetical protein